MPEKSWKVLERRVAEVLGGRRAPLSGSRGSDTTGDVIHPDLYVEVKQRAAGWHVATLFAEVKAKARKEKKMPVLVIHQRRGRSTLAIVELDTLAEALE